MAERKADITVHRVDDVYVWIECELHIAFSLDEFFTFFVPGYRFMPKFKNKMWDGKIHLFSIRNRELYSGLTSYVKQFAEQHKYSIHIDDDVMPQTNVKPEDVVKFLETLNVHSNGEKIEAHDYQLFGIWCALKYKRCILLSPTSSGKSLMIYALARWLRLTRPGKKVLVVVPTTGLVAQMAGDMADYSSHVHWTADDEVHMIMGGREKDSECGIYVSTWQSIFRKHKGYFEKFGTLMIDEVHLATSESLRGICEKMTECPYKIGLTGTLDDSKTSRLVIEGLLGPVKRTITTKELMDRKKVARLNIKALSLIYTDEEKQFMKKAKYQDEVKWLIKHPRRTDFIAKLALAQTQNGLILFNNIEHGKDIYKRIKDIDPNRTVHFVDGSVPADQREQIRHWVEKEKDSIIVASFGTFSTGVSIKNLHWGIFASPSKSKIRTLQSIGRGLRINSEKDSFILYDIADDLTWKRHKNYAMEHFLVRVDYYNREQFEFSLKRIKI